MPASPPGCRQRRIGPAAEAASSWPSAGRRPPLRRARSELGAGIGGLRVRGSDGRRPNLVGQALDVQQMLRRDVVRRDVAPPAAAPERHRRVEAGCQANRPVGRGRIHADAEGRLLEAELEDDVLVPGVDRHRVAHAAVSQNLNTALAALPPVLDDIPGKDRRQLLNREGMVAPDSRERGNQDAGPLRDRDPHLLGDERGRLPDQGRVRQALRRHEDPGQGLHLGLAS